MATIPSNQSLAGRLLARFGYFPKREELDAARFPDISPEDMQALRAVDEFTMTSIERRYHLLQAVRYLAKHEIPGAFVECGVWRGGSMMLMARALKACGDENRDLYLYDTFEGMPPPANFDHDFSGQSALSRLEAEENSKTASRTWAIASLGEVKQQMGGLGYPAEKIHYVAGKVEATIPSVVPRQIALLRLDTDWYESTAHELEHLYPLVVKGGVVIIDDYGYWKGARKAVDEFIAKSTDRILLHRVDDTGRAFVKL